MTKSQGIAAKNEIHEKITHSAIRALLSHNFIIKFGYDARCHWLKERAL